MDCCIIFEGDGNISKDSLRLRGICSDSNDAINLILKHHKFKPEDLISIGELDDLTEDEIEEALQNVIENHLMFDGTVKSEKANLSYIITCFEYSCDFDRWIEDTTEYI